MRSLIYSKAKSAFLSARKSAGVKTRQAVAFAKHPEPVLFVSRIPPEFRAIAFAGGRIEIARFSESILRNKRVFEEDASKQPWLLEIKKIIANKKMSPKEVKRLAKPLAETLLFAEHNLGKNLAEYKTELIIRINIWKKEFAKEIRHINQELLRDVFVAGYLDPLPHSASFEEVLSKFPTGDIHQERHGRTLDGSLTDYVKRVTIDGHTRCIRKEWAKDFDNLIAMAQAFERVKKSREYITSFYA